MIKRGKGKIEVGKGREDMYKLYKEMIKDLPEKYDVSYQLYSRALNMFNKGLSKAILENSLEYVIPCRLGVMRIKKYKPELKIDDQGNLIKKGLNPDWRATNKLWDKDPEAKKEKKLVYHINHHSEGYNYRWWFSDYRSNVRNKSAYCFKPSRTNKRELARLVLDPDFKGDFYE